MEIDFEKVIRDNILRLSVITILIHRVVSSVENQAIFPHLFGKGQYVMIINENTRERYRAWIVQPVGGKARLH